LLKEDYFTFDGFFENVLELDIYQIIKKKNDNSKLSDSLSDSIENDSPDSEFDDKIVNNQQQQQSEQQPQLLQLEKLQQQNMKMAKKFSSRT
jgi:hypothetical protein